ncbi:hypothetical protein ACFW2V_13250 [Streptomyces sp. NPDC058947]|uniref:hypothetical protein n=1 Tax=Streptomyces sp. NPDC058947 TaxID=3346675 RepID=UPI003695510E
MSFNEHEFMKLSMAGLEVADIAERLGVPIEEAQAFANRLGIGMSPSDLFGGKLLEWANEGFIRQGWSIRQEGRNGRYRMKFMVGDSLYDLTETQMEMFVLGVEHMRKFKETR